MMDQVKELGEEDVEFDYAIVPLYELSDKGVLVKAALEEIVKFHMPLNGDILCTRVLDSHRVQFRKKYNLFKKSAGDPMTRIDLILPFASPELQSIIRMSCKTLHDVANLPEPDDETLELFEKREDRVNFVENYNMVVSMAKSLVAPPSQNGDAAGSARKSSVVVK